MTKPTRLCPRVLCDTKECSERSSVSRRWTVSTSPKISLICKLLDQADDGRPSYTEEEIKNMSTEELLAYLRNTAPRRGEDEDEVMEDVTR